MQAKVSLIISILDISDLLEALKKQKKQVLLSASKRSEISQTEMIRETSPT
jgi:hypothetical protein